MSSETTTPANLTTLVIDAQDNAKLLDLADLRQYRDLLFFLVWRDIKALYAQTILGFGWAIIRPVFGTIIFTVVFGTLAGISTDGVPGPLFFYSGQIAWLYFSTALTASTGSMIAGGNLLSKVYFPRIYMPLTPVLTGLVDFLIASVVLIGLLFWYRVNPGFQIIFLPLPILLMTITAAGCGFWLSALAVQFRDVKHGVGFATQLLMYVGPVVYPISEITGKMVEKGWGEHVPLFRLLYGIYPIAGVIEGFRASVLGTGPMPWDLLGVGFISATLLAFSGLYYFKWRERIFADVA